MNEEVGETATLHADIGRRTLIKGAVGTAFIVGGMLQSSTSVSAAPGSVHAEAMYFDGTLYVRGFGAGWRRSTLTYSIEILQNGVHWWGSSWQKFSATSFDRTLVPFDCGSAQYFVKVECWDSYGNNDSDVALAWD